MRKKKIYKAEIIFAGELGSQQREPSARLEDNRIMPMGWNIGQIIPVGTKGTAQYLSTGTMGLWKFTPTPHD